MQKKSCLLILLLFLMHPSPIFANDNEQHWNKINELSNHVLQLGKQKKYEEAKQVIGNFSNLFLKNAFEQGLTIEEIKMIIYSYEQAESALTSITMSDKDRLNKLLQFRLTVNAVTNKHQPLWLDTEKLVIEPLTKAIHANKQGNSNQFHMQLNEFLANYEIIRPSLVISLPEHEAERYDSYVKYIEHVRNNISELNEKNKQLREIEKEFKLLFQQHKQSNVEPELLGLIYIIGSFIAITLIYVGWRKYKGERRKKQMKNFD